MSTRFNFFRVSSVFEFPISLRQLRQIARESRAEFRYIETKGISMSEGFKTRALSSITDDRHAGILDAKRNSWGWVFDLRFCALRSSDVVPSLEAVSESLLADIRNWVEEKLALPSTAPVQQAQLFLGYRPSAEPCESTSFEAKSG